MGALDWISEQASALGTWAENKISGVVRNGIGGALGLSPSTRSPAAPGTQEPGFFEKLGKMFQGSNEVGPDGKPKPSFFGKLFNFDDPIGSGGGMLMGFAAAAITLLTGGGGFMAAIIGIFAMVFGPKLVNAIGSLFGGDILTPSATPAGANPAALAQGAPERTPEVARGAGPQNGNSVVDTVTTFAGNAWESAKDTWYNVSNKVRQAVGASYSPLPAVLAWTDKLNLPAKEKAAGLSTGFLSAIMDQESSGKEGQVSSAKCEGLFQFKKATADELCIDRNKPHEAADGAARMYAQLAKKYNNNYDAMMAGYNWGQGNYDNFVKNGYWTDKQGNKITQLPKETREYIARVKSIMPAYAEASIAIAAAKQAGDGTQIAGAAPTAGPAPVRVAANDPSVTVSPDEAARAAAAAIGQRGAERLAMADTRTVGKQHTFPGAANDGIERTGS